MPISEILILGSDTMSTNYYILTKDKSIIERYGLTYELTNEPDWGYWVHIVQLYSDYVPLFQAHKNVSSLPAVFSLLQETNVTVYDEYYKKMDVAQFCDKLQTICNDDSRKPRTWNMLYDNYLRYFKDAYGNEFLEGDFV